MAKPTFEDLVNRFRHHPPPDQNRIEAHEQIRSIFLEAANASLRLMPESAGRETAVMLTKLEEGMFWANAGIARQPPAGSAKSALGDA